MDKKEFVCIACPNSCKLTVWEEGGEIKGVAVMNVAVSEDAFAELTVGDNWIPQYDYLLFKKNIDISYSAQRDAIK